LRFFKKSAALGQNCKSYSKCGDFYYSLGDKKSAMNCYKKAADLGDVQGLNNIGRMYESGFGDTPPQPKLALQNYKDAHSMGNTDATINLALYYLSGQFQSKDLEQGKTYLIQAHGNKSKRAGDLLLRYGLIKSADELPGLSQEYTRELTANASKKMIAMNTTMRSGHNTGGGSSHGIKRS